MVGMAVVCIALSHDSAGSICGLRLTQSIILKNTLGFSVAT